MISFLINMIKIIFLLGFLIFIHEGGHFLVAKLCKIKVKEFAIGFGPTIWKKQGKETKYAVRLIPLGGFVNLLGEGEHSDEEGSFSKSSIPKRIAIVLAGGIVNIIFGILLYFILVSSSGNYISTTIDKVSPRSTAEISGIKTEDKILKINGKKVRLINDINTKIQESDGKEVTVTIERENNIKNIKLVPDVEEIKTIGIYLGIEGEDLSSEIKSVYKTSSAYEAGLKEGDKILSIDGISTVDNPYAIVKLINESKTEEIILEVKRNDEIKEFKIKPDINKVYKMGVKFKTAEDTFLNNIYYGFWDTSAFLVSITDNIKMLFTGKINAEQLVGPIGISEIVSKTKGTIEFLYMLAIISLSLGVTNLLPFPPLDGGKILILLIEAIRRRPIKESIEMALQVVGFLVLIALSVYVTYNDILRII